MSSTTDALEKIAPEVFARADRDFWITLAAAQLDAVSFGGMYLYAVCYLAAHLATLSPLDADAAADAAGAAGPVTARSTGELSESYASIATSSTVRTLEEAELASTAYGRRFLSIRSSRAAGKARVVVVP